MTETTNASAPVDALLPPAATVPGSPLGDTAITTVANLLVSGKMAGTWRLDSKRSHAEFAGKHFWGALTVRGRFDGLVGRGSVAEDHTVSGHLEIATASVDTDNPRRDKHLRSTRFLNAEAHPKIVLTAVNITVEAHDRLVVRGSLTARGAARPVTFGVDVRKATPDQVVLEADLAVDRSDFGIDWSPLRMASNQVLTHVVAHFVRTAS
jgi:polyisoprenoid-binding protein YceI